MFFKWIVNFWPLQGFRDRRAADIVKILEKSGAIKAFKGDKALFDLGLGQGKILSEISEKIFVDLGAGQGEIPLAISRKAKCSFIGVDQYSDPSEKVEKEEKGKLLWRKEDAIEYLKRRKNKSVDGITVFYFLQVLSPDKQVELLWEIRRVIRPGGKVVFIEEYKRKWPGRWIDIAMNKFLNAFNKQRYEVYSEETWDTIFEIAGEFPISRILYKFGRNSKLFVFEF